MQKQNQIGQYMLIRRVCEAKPHGRKSARLDAAIAADPGHDVQRGFIDGQYERAFRAIPVVPQGRTKRSSQLDVENRVTLEQGRRIRNRRAEQPCQL